jgi:hypothetical protein
MMEQCELLTVGSLLPNSERKGRALQTMAIVGSFCLENKNSGENIKTIEERNVHYERKNKNCYERSKSREVG